MSDFKRKFISPGLPDPENIPSPFPKDPGFKIDCPACGQSNSEGPNKIGPPRTECKFCGQILRDTCCECGGLGGVPNPDACGGGTASRGSDLMRCYHCGGNGMSNRDCCTGFTPELKGENR